MEVSNPGQALGFLAALALGGGLGLLYDFFRLLRRRLGAPWLAAALDLCYWPVGAGVLFWHALEAGGGVIRVYLVLGLLLGGGIYFAVLSRWVLIGGERLADALAALWHLALRPLAWERPCGPKRQGY